MRIELIKEELKRHKIDAWLFFDHHYRDPSSYKVLGIDQGEMLREEVTRRWYYLIPAQGEAKGLVHKIEAFRLDKLPGEKISYASWQQQNVALKQLLNGCKKVAMQYSPNCAIPYVSSVDGGTVELIRSLGVEIVTSADLLQIFEARLSDAQAESHLQAGKLMDQIRAQAFQLIQQKTRGPNSVSEFEIKSFILSEYERLGLITGHGPHVNVNQNASNPHYDPTKEESSLIKRGDFVLVDLWAKLKAAGSIYYDITWCGVCADKIPDQINKVFGIVKEARDAAINLVISKHKKNENLKGYEVDDAARQVIVKSGYGEYFFHRTGHSIGENIHGNSANMDNLEVHDERSIIPGSCFSIEPGIYLPTFGIRSEVNMLIDKHGARVSGEIQNQVLTL